MCMSVCVCTGGNILKLYLRQKRILKAVSFYYTAHIIYIIINFSVIILYLKCLCLNVHTSMKMDALLK